MDTATKLLAAIAALIGAIAWPLTLLVIVFMFRDALHTACSKIIVTFDRVTKVTLAGIALEIDRLVETETKGGDNKEGAITPQQIEAAKRIDVATQEISSAALLTELDFLCSEYEEIRRKLPSGDARTRAMTRVVIKMRALAPRLFRYLAIYKNSAAAGERLAAIAMMQMVPIEADLDWLAHRFSVETPFLFYQAALALQNVAANKFCLLGNLKKIRELAIEALTTVNGFSGGPDENTVMVLENLISSLSQWKDP